MGAFVNLLKAIARTLGVNDQGTPYTPPQTANTYGSIRFNPNAGAEPPQGQRTNAFGQRTDAFQAAGRVGSGLRGTMSSQTNVTSYVGGDYIVTGGNSVGKMTASDGARVSITNNSGNGVVTTSMGDHSPATANFGDVRQGISASATGTTNHHITQQNFGANSITNFGGNQIIGNGNAVAIGNNARVSVVNNHGGNSVTTTSMGDHSPATTNMNSNSPSSSIISSNGTSYQTVSGGKHHGAVLLDSATPSASSPSPQNSPTSPDNSFGTGNSFGSFNNFGNGTQVNGTIHIGNMTGGAVAFGNNARVSVVNNHGGNNVTTTSMGDHSPATTNIQAKGSDGASLPVGAVTTTSMGNGSPATTNIPVRGGDGASLPVRPVSTTSMGNGSPATTNIGGTFNGAMPKAPPSTSAPAASASRAAAPTR